MISAFFEGIAASIEYGPQILALTLFGLGLGALPSLLLFKGKKAGEPRLVLLLLLGFLLVGPAAALLSCLRLLNVWTAGLSLLISLAALVLLWQRGAFARWSRDDLRRYAWIPAAIFFVSIFLRLGFLQGLVLPPFSDSAVHFEDVRRFTNPQSSAGLNLEVFVPYYHRSFHGAAAWLGVLTGRSSPMTMAVAGHLFAALLPVTIYLMLLVLLDGKLSAALLGALMASLGWVMPAHALNFGKYPSFMALALLPLPIGLLHWAAALKDRPRAWWLVLGLSLPLLAWAHSRTAILLAAYALAWLVSRHLARKAPERVLQIGAALLTMFLFAWMMVSSYRESTSHFRYYFTAYNAATFLTAALLPFAFRRQTQMTLSWLLAMAVLMLGVSVPLPSGLFSYDLTLFDAAFFEMSLFLPLTVLSVLGLDGLGKTLPAKETYARDLSIFLALILLVNAALIPQPWKPMNNANYVSRDDLAALNWISRNTPEDATVFISGLQQSERYLRATDAGIWVKALTGRKSIKVPAGLDWNSLQTLEEVCWLYGSQSRFYVYAGSKVNSFQLESCQPPSGMETAFCRPQAKVFLLDCKSLP